MSRTSADVGTDDGFPAAEISPEWTRWADLVAQAVAESRHPAWEHCVRLSSRRPAEAPLLDRASLQLPPRAGEHTARVARELGIVGLAASDTSDVVRVGVERDMGGTDEMAARLALSSDTMALFGQLAAVPVLVTAAAALGRDASRSWQRGYCPVCGAWPSLVELRGIERERRLRCGCCGSDWMLPVLRCAFCDEMDHAKLGSLLSETERHVRVETCATCHGYLKSVPTLTAIPFEALPMKDLSTISFDLAAHDRGYFRPADPGWQLRVEIL